MSVYNTQEIMEILPHRHPFLLIDTIEELEPGVRAVGRKNVTFNEPYFAGHFSGKSGDARSTDPGGTCPDRCGGNFVSAGEPRQDSLFCRD